MRLRKRLPRRVQSNEDAAAAVEFALIAPILALFYLGSIEISFMLEDDRRLTNVASTFADLATRFEELDETALDEIHHAARMVMLPADISNARIRLSSLVLDGSDVKVEWSTGCNWSKRVKDTTVSIPTALEPAAGQSVIMAEIEMDVSGMFGYLPGANATLSDVVYATPREVSKLPLDPTNLESTYTCPFGSGGP